MDEKRTLDLLAQYSYALRRRKDAEDAWFVAENALMDADQEVAKYKELLEESILNEDV